MHRAIHLAESDNLSLIGIIRHRTTGTHSIHSTGGGGRGEQLSNALSSQVLPEEKMDETIPY